MLRESEHGGVLVADGFNGEIILVAVESPSRIGAMQVKGALLQQLIPKPF